MSNMEIVEQDAAGAEWRPWQPPLWVIAIGLSLALVVGFAQAGQVRDPRLQRVVGPAPTPCALHAVPIGRGPSVSWENCR